MFLLLRGFYAYYQKIGPKTTEKLHSLIKNNAKLNNLDFCDSLSCKEILKKVPNDAKDEWDSLVDTLREISGMIETSEPEVIVKAAVEGWYGSYIRQIYPNWTEREEDLISLIGFASRFENLEDLLAQLVLLASEISDRSENDNKDALRLTTVHQAKGLEFPIVFIIGLADGLFPLKRTIDDGTIEEARRLFYVASTRAEKELYLCYPMLNSQNNNMIRLNPSRFIQEIDAKLFQTLKVSPNRQW